MKINKKHLSKTGILIFISVLQKILLTLKYLKQLTLFLNRDYKILNFKFIFLG